MSQNTKKNYTKKRLKFTERLLPLQPDVNYEVMIQNIEKNLNLTKNIEGKIENIEIVGCFNYLKSMIKSIIKEVSKNEVSKKNLEEKLIYLKNIQNDLENIQNDYIKLLEEMKKFDSEIEKKYKKDIIFLIIIGCIKKLRLKMTLINSKIMNEPYIGTPTFSNPKKRDNFYVYKTYIENKKDSFKNELLRNNQIIKSNQRAVFVIIKNHIGLYDLWIKNKDTKKINITKEDIKKLKTI